MTYSASSASVSGGGVAEVSSSSSSRQGSSGSIGSGWSLDLIPQHTQSGMCICTLGVTLPADMQSHWLAAQKSCWLLYKAGWMTDLVARRGQHAVLVCLLLLKPCCNVAAAAATAA